MLQTVVQYLVQNPEIREKLKKGKASLIGLSKMEQKAILDVLRNSDSSFVSPMEYW